LGDLRKGGFLAHRSSIGEAQMRQKSVTRAATPEQIVKDIRRATRKHHSAEEKIRVVLEGLRGEYSITELCRREGIAESLYYSWSKEFLEAGKKRLAGDTARAATSGEVKDLRREVREMKVLVADLTLENRLLKRDCQESCARGHSDGKENHLWQSTRNFWTSCWLDVTPRSCFRGTAFSTN
jgi:transposase